MKTSAGIHDKGQFSLQKIINGTRAKTDFHKVGAIGIFIGVVRGEATRHQKVEKLHLEAYEEQAEAVLRQICNELKKRPGIVDVQIHHLLGEFDAGEDLVYVLVAGSHRQHAFPILEEAVERYKKEAPIFKKELVIDEKGRKKARWVSETGSFQEE